mgnify:CR=1 FL=1
MQLIIEAIDTLFFRDAKPFNSTESSFAQTFVEPYPSTLYGALRSKIVGEEVDDYNKFRAGELGKITEVVGTPEQPGSLAIDFFALWDGDLKEPLVTIPNDIVSFKDETKAEIFSLQLREVPEWLKMNYDCNFILANPKQGKVEGIKNGYLTYSELENYLNGEEIDKTEFKVNKEYRTGIKIDQNTGTAQESYLYSKEMLRFADEDGFYLEVSGAQGLFPNSGLLKLGGENKVAKYAEPQQKKEKIKLTAATKEEIKTSKKFKVCLTTPSIFEQGWLPAWIDKDTLSGQIPNSDLEVKLLTAAVGKHSMNSGWDVANRCPKPGYRTVPAGSVYYFEVQDEKFAVEDLIDALHGRTISDKKSKAGFGISYIGRIK